MRRGFSSSWGRRPSPPFSWAWPARLRRPLAFFAGTAVFALPLIRAGGPAAWAASSILIGVLLVLAEILTAQVVLSQLGNGLVFCGSALAAWLVLEGPAGQRSLA
jgi:hypothetical protein